MPRQARIDFPNALQNVCSHGVHDQDIFLDDADRHMRLNLIERIVVEFAWILIAFVLMRNHEHLFVLTPLGNLGEGMRKLNGEYSRRFNRRHHRRGYLYKERFYSQLVEGPDCFAMVSRYFDLNPCRAGIVERPELYPWGSCHMYFDPSRAVPWLDTSYVLGEFVGDRAAQVQAYQKFVYDGLAHPPRSLRDEAYLGRFLGRASWAKAMAARFGMDVAGLPERWQDLALLRNSLDAVLSEVLAEAKDRYVLGATAFVAAETCGLAQREIARALGVQSQSVVSRAIRRMTAELPRELREKLLAAGRALVDPRA